MRKIGANVTHDFGNTTEEALRAIKSAGFDAFFTDFGREYIAECAKLAEKLDLAYDTVHAQFGKVDGIDINTLWQDGEDGDRYAAGLAATVNDAADFGVPTVIMHTTIGNVLPHLCRVGFDRVGKVIEQAEKRGVTLAFENLEYPEPVGIILNKYKSKNVGYCYDIGHEYCYTPGIKYLKMYGDRLAALHLHDNDGLADSMDPCYRDDYHRIPFDGKVDYNRFANELRETGYEGTIMLEIGNRKDYDVYHDLTLAEFCEKGARAAEKIRALVDGE